MTIPRQFKSKSVLLGFIFGLKTKKDSKETQISIPLSIPQKLLLFFSFFASRLCLNINIKTRLIHQQRDNAREHQIGVQSVVSGQ